MHGSVVSISRVSAKRGGNDRRNASQEIIFHYHVSAYQEDAENYAGPLSFEVSPHFAAADAALV